jgi:hypothetical protein
MPCWKFSLAQGAEGAAAGADDSGVAEPAADDGSLAFLSSPPQATIAAIDTTEASRARTAIFFMGIILLRRCKHVYG